MERTTIVFNLNWKKAIQGYSADIRLEIYEAVFEYASTGTIPELSPLAAMAFEFIRFEIEHNNEKFDKKIEARKIAGRKGGYKKATNSKQNVANVSKNNFATNSKQNIANVAENENENEYEYENEYENEVLSSNEDENIDKKTSSDEDEKKDIIDSQQTFDDFAKQALSENEKSWHEALAMKYGILNPKQAIEDFRLHLTLNPRSSPIRSLSEFKRHFSNVANKCTDFLSEKAKARPPIPVCVEVTIGNERFARQFGQDFALPDDAPPIPDDDPRWYWDMDWYNWRKI